MIHPYTYCAKTREIKRQLNIKQNIVKQNTAEFTKQNIIELTIKQNAAQHIINQNAALKQNVAEMTEIYDWEPCDDY